MGGPWGRGVQTGPLRFWVFFFFFLTV